MKIRNLFKSKTVETPTLVIQHDELKEALADLASVFGDGMTADHTGPAFSCGEADTIARVLALSGHREAAETWLSGHAQGDEGDDYHFTVNDEDPNDEGRPLNDKEIAGYVTDLGAAPSVAELVELIGL
ncbi:hypothetical protein [Streptomyces sp. NPDC051546]|uniref:hypothetical protein n=1 Tax=Streptomyces sp. NPDC051546 TaxID=3365655 RepID=UPI0037AB22A3